MGSRASDPQEKEPGKEGKRPRSRDVQDTVKGQKQMHMQWERRGDLRSVWR